MQRVEDSLPPPAKTEKKKVPLSRRLIKGAFGLFLGAAAFPVLIVFNFKESFNNPVAGFFVSVLLMLLTLLISILIHEAGHLVCGLISGYSFYLFRIFNIAIMRQGGSIKLRRFGMPGTGGQCLMKPPPWNNGKVPYFLHFLGGALMNLAVSAVFAVVSAFVINDPILLSFSLMMVFQGMYLALTNGIPDTIGDIDNDGKHIIKFEKNPEAFRAHWISMQMIILMSENVRIKDMPEAWFQPLSESALQSNDPLPFAFMHLDRLVGTEKLEEAAALLELYLKPEREISAHNRKVAQAELVFLECVLKQRPERLKSLLSEEQMKYIKLCQKSSPSVFRTQYCCLLFLEQNEEKASEHRSRFDKLFKHYPYSLIVEGAREDMDLALDIYRKRKENPA